MIKSFVQSLFNDFIFKTITLPIKIHKHLYLMADIFDLYKI